MLKIGLTGGIGSGKSTVAQIFKHLKVPLYVADDKAKMLMNKNDALRSMIISEFGQKAYTNGILNSAYIASVVFDNPEKLKILNRIVHPAVREDFLFWIREHRDRPYLIQEAAILFESGHYKHFDYIIFVNAGKELRINRVMERDKVSREVVKKRMEQQWPEAEKKKKSDFIINNNNGDLILSQVLGLHNKFISLQQ